MPKKQLIPLLAGAAVCLLGASSGQAQPVLDVSLDSSAKRAKQSEVHRDGLFGGMSFGRGSIEVSCDSCGDGSETLSEALSLEGHVGYMVTPQLALVGEHWTVRYNARGGALFDDSASHLVAQHISSVGAQLFLGHSVWVRTGLGVGWHITDGDYAKRAGPAQREQALGNGAVGAPLPPEQGPSENVSGTGAAYFAALGWEFAHNESFAAEVQLRAASTHRPGDEYQVRNIGLNVGASWY